MAFVAAIATVEKSISLRKDRTAAAEKAERIRGEVKFESVDALKAQIAKDVERARELVR